jgi:hypothetical protein
MELMFTQSFWLAGMLVAAIYIAVISFKELQSSFKKK